MVSLGSHHLRVWDVNDRDQIVDPENPKWETIAMRTGGQEVELPEAHAVFEGMLETFMVPYNAGYYVTMAADLRIAGDYDWSLHRIKDVRHERAVGLSILVLEPRQGSAGYELGAFSDGFSDGWS